MALDLYHRNQQTVGGVFTSDRAVATLAAGGQTWVAALVQSVQASYNQQFSEFYEIGSNLVYRALGRPQGRMTIGRIIGKAGTGGIDEVFFDACNNSGGTMIIRAQSTECTAQGGSITMTFKGMFVVEYGVAIESQTSMLRENVTLAFTSFNRTLT